MIDDNLPRHGREPRVTDAFLALTHAVVDDSLDLLSTLAELSVELLEVSAAGIVVVGDRPGGLSVAAAGSEVARLLGEFAVSIDDGPGPDCVRSGGPVIVRDIVSAPDRDRWPASAPVRPSAGSAPCTRCRCATATGCSAC